MTPSLRVALVHHTFSTLGGTARYGLDLARGLRDLGDEVFLFGQRLTVPTELPPDALRGIHWRPVSRSGPGTLIKTLSFNALSARALKRAHHTQPLDVVLGLGKTLEHDVLRLGGGCHAAYLETLHGWSAGQPAAPGLHALDRFLLSLERRQLTQPSTRRIVAVSERVRQEVLARYPVAPDRVVVVHNGVDLSRFALGHLQADREVVRAELGIPPQACVVTFVGDGLERKGMPLLLQAFPRMVILARAQGFSLPLWLLVVGRDGEKLAPRLGALERWLGEVNAGVSLTGQRADVERLYAASDVLTLPTRYEPFGNVCLEAMAMGLPVVTTTVNGVAELYQGEARQLLHAPEDGDALVGLLLGLLEPSRRARLGALMNRLAQAQGLAAHVSRMREVLLEASRHRLAPLV